MVVACSTTAHPDKTTLDAAYAAAAKLKALAGELTEIFPEREDLINQIVFALATREHVLIYGPFGTGKSDLIRTMFESITGSTQFGISLNKFMKETDIIGLPDPKRMREQGEVHYQTDGGILDAEFVELDEILDANSPVLRSLLNILNERQFKRGRQLENAKLHSAVASTNWSPQKAVEHDGGLGAVLDRFIFHSQVDYLEDPESRQQMYAKYLAGAKPSVKVSYDEINALSSIVVGPCQIQNPLIMEVFDEVLTRFKARFPKQTVSDRRACKLMKCMEANALLNGRYDVDVEDVYAIRWGLCLAGDADQMDVFLEITDTVIEEARTRSVNPDEVLMKLLEKYEAGLPSLSANPDMIEIMENLRAVKIMRQELLEMVTTVESADRKKQDLLAELDEIEDEINRQLVG